MISEDKNENGNPKMTNDTSLNQYDNRIGDPYNLPDSNNRSPWQQQDSTSTEHSPNSTQDGSIELTNQVEEEETNGNNSEEGVIPFQKRNSFRYIKKNALKQGQQNNRKRNQQGLNKRPLKMADIRELHKSKSWQKGSWFSFQFEIKFIRGASNINMQL